MGPAFAGLGGLGGMGMGGLNVNPNEMMNMMQVRKLGGGTVCGNVQAMRAVAAGAAGRMCTRAGSDRVRRAHCPRRVH
jgi:hypothetical protein